MSLPSVWPQRVKSGNTTIPIYSRKTSKGYQEFKVVWYDADRKRRFKSFASFDDARKHALSVNAAISTGDINTVTLGNDERLVYLRAKDALKDNATPLDAAATQFAQAARELNGVPLIEAVRFYLQKHHRTLQPRRVRDLVAEFVEAKRKDKLSPEYIRDLEMRLGHFAECFQVDVASLSAEQINGFLRDELAEVGGRTRNNYRAAIGTLLNFAKTQGYISRDDIDVENLARAKESAFAIDIYSPEEMVKLLKAANLSPGKLSPGQNLRYATKQDAVVFLALGAFAGLRTKEIQRQCWEDINIERGVLRVTGAKGNTAQRRLVPISPNLRQWLASCPQREGPCCDYPRPWEALERIAKRAKVGLKHNGLRHSFISYRVAETNNVPQVALEAGNSVAMIHRHYRELVTEIEAKAWFAIAP